MKFSTLSILCAPGILCSPNLTDWTDVNTTPETWFIRDGLLVCKGKPIGVMRSNKQ